MGDAREHNTHNALFFEHNPADPLTFCFRDRGEGRMQFYEAWFFSLPSGFAWLFWVGNKLCKDFFKIKHMTWITKEIAQFFSMAPFARVFFSGKNHWDKFYQTFATTVITSDAWNFRTFFCPKLKSFENVWPVRKQAIVWQFISMAMEITVKQKYST